jgi:hypothetical protein
MYEISIDERDMAVLRQAHFGYAVDFGPWTV